MQYAQSHARSVLSDARGKIILMILEENGIEYCQETPVEVAVSYDGTWSKRGFTANFGLGIVISVDSGQDLYFKFLSKFGKISAIFRQLPKARSILLIKAPAITFPKLSNKLPAGRTPLIVGWDFQVEEYCWKIISL
eukprot:gene5619-10830_t